MRIRRMTWRDFLDLRRTSFGSATRMSGPQALGCRSQPFDGRSTDRHLTLNRFSTGISTCSASPTPLVRFESTLDVRPLGEARVNSRSHKSSSFQERLLSARTSRLRDAMTLRPSPSAPPPEAVSAWDGVSIQSDDPLPGLRARPVNVRARNALITRFRPDADPVPPSSRGMRRVEVGSSIRVASAWSALRPLEPSNGAKHRSPGTLRLVPLRGSDSLCPARRSPIPS
jgi:hypothetical protein